MLLEIDLQLCKYYKVNWVHSCLGIGREFEFVSADEVDKDCEFGYLCFKSVSIPAGWTFPECHKWLDLCNVRFLFDSVNYFIFPY